MLIALYWQSSGPTTIQAVMPQGDMGHVGETIERWYVSPHVGRVTEYYHNVYVSY